MKRFLITATALAVAAGFTTALLLHYTKKEMEEAFNFDEPDCDCGNCGMDPNTCECKCEDCEGDCLDCSD